MRSSSSKFISIAEVLLLAGHGKLVFTNGCFDLFHAGHVDLLERARQLGDCLVVAVNTDDSVRALKGLDRPVNRFEDRVRVIGACEAVDYVVALPETRAGSLLVQLRPQVWVKGGDYTLATLDAGERELAEQHRVKIVFVPRLSPCSTTAIQRRL